MYSQLFSYQAEINRLKKEFDDFQEYFQNQVSSIENSLIRENQYQQDQIAELESLANPFSNNGIAICNYEDY